MLQFRVTQNAIRSGAYQAGFYACEVSYVGLNILKSLRSSAAAIFAKQTRGINPKAVLLTVDRGIHDPRVYVILRTITAAKRALTKFPEQYSQLWTLVVGHSKRAFGLARWMPQTQPSGCSAFAFPRPSVGLVGCSACLTMVHRLVP